VRPAARAISHPFDYGSLRKRFAGAYIANNGYDFELANKVLAADEADLIAFGSRSSPIPTLVERLSAAPRSTRRNKATFYGGGAKGYTDYPLLGDSLQRRSSTPCPGPRRGILHGRSAEPGPYHTPEFVTAPAQQRTAERCAASGEREV